MRIVRRGLSAAGTLVMGYAVVGALTDPDVKPFGVLILLAGVVVGHDGILLPVMIGVGVLIGRFVPTGDRIAVRAAALCSLAVTVVALPLVLGYGRTADNPSVLPLPYGRGLATVLLMIWTVALAMIVVRRIRKHLERTATARSGPPDG
jgi:hypothetical protein